MVEISGSIQNQVRLFFLYGFKMTIRKILYWIFAVLSSLYFALLIYYYPFLPERIASHFNISGEADGWMNKESFLILMIIIFVVVNGSLFGITFFIKSSTSIINIPNKEYYLSPERKDASLKIINNFLMLINNLTIVLIIVINYLIIRTNIEGTDKLTSYFIYIIIIYFLAMALIVFKIFTYFKKPPMVHENKF